MSWHDWLDLIQLFAPSLITAAALGIGASIIGFFVILRGESLMALALPQVVAVGAALALRWELEGWKTLPPPLAVALAALAYFVLAKRAESERGCCPAFMSRECVFRSCSSRTRGRK